MENGKTIYDGINRPSQKQSGISKKEYDLIIKMTREGKENLAIFRGHANLSLGLFAGLIFGIVGNLFVAQFYDLLIKDSPIFVQIIIFLAVTFLTFFILKIIIDDIRLSERKIRFTQKVLSHTDNFIRNYKKNSNRAVSH